MFGRVFFFSSVGSLRTPGLSVYMQCEFIYQVHYSENNFINDDNKSHLIKSLGIVSV